MAALKIENFQRNPFFVKAVRVTEENINEVASWCDGFVYVVDKPQGASVEKYIRVRATHPLCDRQTKAFFGDWVLYTPKGYKVYTDRAFKRGFTEAEPPKASIQIIDKETLRIDMIKGDI